MQQNKLKKLKSKWLGKLIAITMTTLYNLLPIFLQELAI